VEIFTIIFVLFVAILMSYGQQLIDRMKPMIMTIFVGWLITRFCDRQHPYYRIDVITVHFVVCQFISLMYKWQDFELESPFPMVQQASCCISACVRAFLQHEFSLRYFPFQFKILVLWMMSFFDM